MAKLPSFQFYPGDWMKDPALRSCTLAARGVYVDLLCLMFESPQRGVLRQNRAPMRLQLIASMVQKARPSHVKELIDKGVLKVARKDGAVYSKRMVRDELRRRHLSAKGRLGGLAKACLNPAQPLANTLPKPSSSSSSSSSTSVKEETPP